VPFDTFRAVLFGKITAWYFNYTVSYKPLCFYHLSYVCTHVYVYTYIFESRFYCYKYVSLFQISIFGLAHVSGPHPPTLGHTRPCTFLAFIHSSMDGDIKWRSFITDHMTREYPRNAKSWVSKISNETRASMAQPRPLVTSPDILIKRLYFDNRFRNKNNDRNILTVIMKMSFCA